MEHSICKEPACNAGDLDLVPGSGRFPGEWNGNLLQYSCLGNPMVRGAWQATVDGVAKSWTRLSDFPLLTHAQEVQDNLDLEGLLRKADSMPSKGFCKFLGLGLRCGAAELFDVL